MDHCDAIEKLRSAGHARVNIEGCNDSVFNFISQASLDELTPLLQRLREFQVTEQTQLPYTCTGFLQLDSDCYHRAEILSQFSSSAAPLLVDLYTIGDERKHQFVYKREDLDDDTFVASMFVVLNRLLDKLKVDSSHRLGSTNAYMTMAPDVIDVDQVFEAQAKGYTSQDMLSKPDLLVRQPAPDSDSSPLPSANQATLSVVKKYRNFAELPEMDLDKIGESEAQEMETTAQDVDDHDDEMDDASSSPPPKKEPRSSFTIQLPDLSDAVTRADFLKAHPYLRVPCYAVYSFHYAHVNSVDSKGPAPEPCGLMECVPGEPLSKFTEAEVVALLQSHKDVVALLDTLAASLAAAYFVGLRDRHYDNYMITTNGLFCHIDLGNFANERAFMDAKSISVTPTMVRAIKRFDPDAWEYVAQMAKGVMQIFQAHLEALLIQAEQLDSARFERLESYVRRHVAPKGSPEKVYRMVLRADRFRTNVKNFMHEYVAVPVSKLMHGQS